MERTDDHARRPRAAGGAVKKRGIIVIELDLGAEPGNQFQEALRAFPARVPHGTGQVIVAIDGPGDETLATDVINRLGGKTVDGVTKDSAP